MPAHLLPLSRRQFLAGTTAMAATIGQSNLLGADPDVNPDLWALFSDTHLLSNESIQKHYRAQRTAREKRAALVSNNFDQAAKQVNALPEKPAGLLLNGDCVHVGGKEEYDQLAQKFAHFEDTPVHVTMGNHDHRGDFSRAFQKQARVLLENRHVSLVKSRHANFVLLDSLTMKTPERPVKGPGILGQEQLEWFESILDAEPNQPTIVMFHHNIDPSVEYERRSEEKKVIVPSASPIQKVTGLEDSDKLLDLLASKPHVKAILTGHMHQYRVLKWRKLHFIFLPSVGYTFHAKEPAAWMQMLLQENGASLELRTLDPKHVRNHHRISLNWG